MHPFQQLGLRYDRSSMTALRNALVPCRLHTSWAIIRLGRRADPVDTPTIARDALHRGAPVVNDM